MPFITAICYSNRHKNGFEINRKQGYSEYSFVHFTDGIYTIIDGKQIFMPEHSCIIWRPNTPQYFFSPTNVTHDWFHFTGEVETFITSLNLPIDEWIHPCDWHFISKAIKEMHLEFFSNRPHREVLLSLKAKEVFTQLSRTLSENTAIDTTIQKIQQIRSEMLISPEHPWTVKELSARISFSQSRFHALYRKTFGVSPIDELIQMRMNSAKRELDYTNRSIEDIADSLGYNNVTHFSRQFHRFVGISPREYRLKKK